MRLLLDTHLLLWWLMENRELGREAKALIADSDNTIFVSTVSLWEVWLKQSLGKLRLPPDFQARLDAESFEILPLSGAHARKVAELPWLHRDPFDRMLVAQAMTEPAHLLTADSLLSAYSELVRVI